MKKFLFILFGLFVVMGAFAAGENVPTSKSYVDAAVAQKQDKISANIIMPAGYIRLAYLESTGTQWIDTGVVFNSGIGYELEYQPITTNKFVIQAGTTGQVIAQKGNVWEFRFNGSINRRPSPSVIDLTRFVNIKYNIDNKCSVDNRIVYIGDLILNAGGSIRLFGPNVASSGRMSFFLIYDNGVLVNNLVAARRDSDNVVGMYDTISGRFFTNSGTGEFVAGPVIGNQNQVLTNTGTAGEYGTKGIYDANGAYVTQTQNLVDAVTMNTAVQNAIDSEFQCVSWVDDDPTKDCLLMDVFGTTERKVPNLLNPDVFTYGVINSDGEVSASNYSAIFGPIAVTPGTKYTFSGKANTPGGLYKQIHGYDSNDNWVSRLAHVGAHTNRYKITVTIPENVSYVRLSGVYYKTNDRYSDTELQFEQGSTATPYNPYGANLYLPTGE